MPIIFKNNYLPIYAIFITISLMSILSPIKFFIKDSRATGVLLIGCTAVSLLLSQGAWGNDYIAFWGRKFTTHSTAINLPDNLLHCINDILMSVFFFSAGLEIKREVLTGELNTLKKALMPAISAAGGMLLPAIIYAACCHNKETFMGWGIPMATDIAFSLGVLSLLGRRAPLSMRIFLTAIAIIDDIGGILTIAVFYAAHLYWLYMGLATMTVILLLVLNYLRVTRLSPYLLAGLLLWYFIYNSGINPTIAGVILACTIPSAAIHKLEQGLRIPVNFIILPLFALANTAMALPHDIPAIITAQVHYGIFLGLLVGKPIGIFLATYAALKLKIAAIPLNITMKQVFGIGIIAGIGFTVSIFITMLAFSDTQTQFVAKLAVINASVCSGIAGYCFLRFTNRKQYGN